MVAGNVDELEFGSRQGDQKAWFPDQTALLDVWKNRHTLIFLKKGELQGLLPQLDPQPVIKAESGRRLLISNR
jgi:hypothetical protein